MNIPDIIANYKNTGLSPTAEVFAALCAHIENTANLEIEVAALRAELERYKNSVGMEYAEQITDERDALRAEVERLTDGMSWSEAKAHERLADANVELAALRAQLAEEKQAHTATAETLWETCTERDALRAANTEWKIQCDEQTASLDALRLELAAQKVVLTGDQQQDREMAQKFYEQCEQLKAERDALRASCEKWNQIAHDRQQELAAFLAAYAVDGHGDVHELP